MPEILEKVAALIIMHKFLYISYGDYKNSVLFLDID